ncbi:unnamed protein product [Danaus chrysippus]|uniref:(African queen) hypothetical protein n=1 Tax=Danaus chrysippus TaxID=151541 RepID=A0A8J2R0P4_9NEOP|nr:unnamed protein product [Danaus chrysippus]
MSLAGSPLRSPATIWLGAINLEESSANYSKAPLGRRNPDAPGSARSSSERMFYVYIYTSQLGEVWYLCVDTWCHGSVADSYRESSVD